MAVVVHTELRLQGRVDHDHALEFHQESLVQGVGLAGHAHVGVQLREVRAAGGRAGLPEVRLAQVPDLRDVS